MPDPIVIDAAHDLQHVQHAIMELKKLRQQYIAYANSGALTAVWSAIASLDGSFDKRIA
jgi:hypothetical protein